MIPTCSTKERKNLSLQNKIIVIANHKLFIFAGIVLYAILFEPVFNLIGGAVASFGFVLTLLGGWCCGILGACIVGTLISIINSIGFRIVAYSHIITDIASFLLITSFGILIAKIRSHYKIYQTQTDDLKTEKAALSEEIEYRKQAEEEFITINNELVKTNQRLKQTQAQLVHSSKMASLGVLAANIAHELNQPLATITLNTEMILQDLHSGKQDELEELSKNILNQLKRSQRIIDHLKIFGRDSDSHPYEDRDFNTIIDDSFILINMRLKMNEIKLIKELSKFPLIIHCNFIQIEQVITNVICNAIDALENQNAPVLVIRSFKENDMAVVEVEDNGCGIPEENLERIFDPFFTTKEVGKGIGLGLSTCYGFIQDNRGEITASSELNKKTIFRIKIPLALK